MKKLRYFSILATMFLMMSSKVFAGDTYVSCVTEKAWRSGDPLSSEDPVISVSYDVDISNITEITLTDYDSLEKISIKFSQVKFKTLNHPEYYKYEISIKEKNSETNFEVLNSEFEQPVIVSNNLICMAHD